MSRSKQSISSWMKQRVQELSKSPRTRTRTRSRTPIARSRSKPFKSRSKPFKSRSKTRSRPKVIVEDDDSYVKSKSKTKSRTRTRTRRKDPEEPDMRLRLYQAPLQFARQPSRLSQRLVQRQRTPVVNIPDDELFDDEDESSSSESEDEQPQRRFVQKYRQVPCNGKDDKIYCGSKCYLPNNTYARFGTPFECMLKGMGIGMYRERERRIL